MPSIKDNLVVLLAGGIGARMEQDIPKQFMKLGKRLVIEHSIDRFESHPGIKSIYVVTHPDYYDKTEALLGKNSYKKVKKNLRGGKTRQESSEIGVLSAADHYDNVLIHDMVRPLISKQTISDILEMLNSHEAVGIVSPTSDTVVKVSRDGLIEEIPDRSEFRFIQTPQAFILGIIQKAHRLAKEQGVVNSTDDCSLVLRFNLSPIYVLEGSPLNIKITRPSDLQIAERILKILEEKDT